MKGMTIKENSEPEDKIEDPILLLLLPGAGLK